MNSDELAQRLHEKATRGEVLSAEERTQLDQWYAQQDRAEDAVLSRTAPPFLEAVMDQQAVWDAVQAWPVEERIEFAARLLDQVTDDGRPPELTDEELMAELDRRWANFQANPDSGRTWEQVVAHIVGPR